jgi:hypothetical protein
MGYGCTGQRWKGGQKEGKGINSQVLEADAQDLGRAGITTEIKVLIISQLKTGQKES